ncbi:hypothetical protein PFWH6_5437 [Pseudomonas fluorescens WH6]|nr:hypothetical protein PFWH6_5437 [Pseudomonas fluorescens WH6]
MPRGRQSRVQKRQGNCRKRQSATKGVKRCLTGGCYLSYA